MLIIDIDDSDIFLLQKALERLYSAYETLCNSALHSDDASGSSKIWTHDAFSVEVSRLIGKDLSFLLFLTVARLV